MSLFETGLLLLAGHFIADFWMQSDALARMKNRHRKPEVPPGQTPQTIWPYALSAHASHHGVCVALATGSWTLGLAEMVAHAVVDFGKCENWYGIHVDQALHLVCKVAWLVVIVLAAPSNVR